MLPEKTYKTGGAGANVVIIGRPNVGKSTLYNRLSGSRKALVHHAPGTTRDRNESLITWEGKHFTIVDTGGWEEAGSSISGAVRKQMLTALEGATIVLMIVDGKNGFHPIDAEIALLLRKEHKKTLVAVNKIDTVRDEPKANDFYRLGFDTVIPVSGTHGTNTGELLDIIAANLPDEASELPQIYDDSIRVVLVGKPNVGKSSLLNALAKEERVIVNEKPGTTREAVDIILQRPDQNFVLVDTPGLHRRHKITDEMEYLATLSAHNAIERADVGVLIIDALQGIGETEARISELILKNHRGCLIAVNKWDVVEQREEAVRAMREQLENKLPFLWWAKLIFISAKTGQRTERILDEVKAVYAQYTRMAPPDELTELIRTAIHRRPPSRRGKTLRLVSVQQTGTRAPYFVCNVNRTDIIHFSYRRYLENIIRERFGFEGTPIVLRFKSGNPAGKKK